MGKERKLPALEEAAIVAGQAKRVLDDQGLVDEIGVAGFEQAIAHDLQAPPFGQRKAMLKAIGKERQQQQIDRRAPGIPQYRPQHKPRRSGQQRRQPPPGQLLGDQRPEPVGQDLEDRHLENIRRRPEPGGCQTAADQRVVPGRTGPTAGGRKPAPQKQRSRKQCQYGSARGPVSLVVEVLQRVYILPVDDAVQPVDRRLAQIRTPHQGATPYLVCQPQAESPGHGQSGQQEQPPQANYCRTPVGCVAAGRKHHLVCPPGDNRQNRKGRSAGRQGAGSFHAGGRSKGRANPQLGMQRRRTARLSPGRVT